MSTHCTIFALFNIQRLMEQAFTIADGALVYGVVWIYAVIAISSLIENLFPPFPGDLVTVLGAALAVAGRLSVVGVFSAACLGGLVSVMIVYYAGRRYGHSFFMEKDYRFFPRQKILQFEKWLERWGVWVIVAHRFVVGFRTVIALCAGIGRWGAWRMAIYSLLSFALFNGALVALTYLVVGNLARAQKFIDAYEMVVWSFLAIGVVAFIWWMRRRRDDSEKLP